MAAHIDTGRPRARFFRLLPVLALLAGVLLSQFAAAPAEAQTLPTISFDDISGTGSNTVSEAGLPDTVSVTLSEALDVTATVGLSVRAGGSATEGVDYTLSTKRLTFAPGTTSQSFTITAAMDFEEEGLET